MVTNAHVVAGQDDTTVELGGEGPRRTPRRSGSTRATTWRCCGCPTWRASPRFAIRRDAPAGALAAAILGFPENGPYDVRPARLGQTETVLTQDAYGRGPVRREITVAAGPVRSGNSGGPVVDGAGRVLATIFAASVSDGGRSGFGVPDSVVRDALRRAGSPVDTGPCVR